MGLEFYSDLFDQIVHISGELKPRNSRCRGVDVNFSYHSSLLLALLLLIF